NKSASPQKYKKEGNGKCQEDDERTKAKERETGHHASETIAKKACLSLSVFVILRNHLTYTMRIQQLLPGLAFAFLIAGSNGAPNGTKSFFPSSPRVDVNRGNADPYMAQASEFFPSSSNDDMKHLKFPEGSQKSSNSEAAQHQQQQAPSVIIPFETPNTTDEAEANEAIDVILKSARAGKSLNLAEGGEELVKVASDPVIREQLASGNEAEARGYIRNKLCSLGLMPCNHFGQVDKQGLLPPGAGYGIGPGHGQGGWAPGIPARDVALVQPVALKPVGHPIAAVPLDHHKPFPPAHHRGYGPHGHGKGIYGPPPPPHHRPGPPPRPYGPPPPPPGHGGIPPPGKPVIEHVHHHIHHQPPSVTVHHGPTYSGPDGFGPLSGSEEYGLSAKNPIAVSTPGGTNIATFIPQQSQKSQSLGEIETNSFNAGSSRFHSASSSSFSGSGSGHSGFNSNSGSGHSGFNSNSGSSGSSGFNSNSGSGSSGFNSGSSNFNGDYNRVEDCTCVRITDCASYDIVGQSTSGREIISGFGKPNYGQVGYGIDPRNKLASGIESNSTDSADGSSAEEDDSGESSGEAQNEARSSKTSIEADSSEDGESTTTLPEFEERVRSKRDTQTQTSVNVPVQDEQTAASGDGTSEPRQLNIGGNCPGGYVCCRNPRQNNLYKPSGSGSNNFQQVANSPFGGQNGNGINSNSFNQGQGQCGKRNARGITGRISNPGFTEGDTDYGEYPWQVAILKKDGYDNVYVCGGALLDNRHIITAAHCIKGHGPTELRVRLGEWDVNHETEFYPHVERDVAAIAIHPEFYAGNLFNDIAIVKMEGYIDFRQNPHISPICIPPKGYEFAGKRCFVTGWGKDAFGEIGKYQNVLKEVDLPVLNNFDCEQKLKRTRLGADFVLHPGFLCAGGEAGRDACKGDGGGPLVCEVGGTWQIGGIVSWGVGCGQQDVPGVYVKVSQYNDWIKKTIGGH
ncbi:Serine proteinase stubble, partial [Orchesella cincta]